MPKCIIDNKEIEFLHGENLIQVAKKAGIDIPYFCYHPSLSIVAQCRMCAVEIDKMPKLQTACSTPALDGMVVKTKSSKVVQNQKSIMEFLLINHPLDCPVCDKSGECDLQDYSFDYGEPYSRHSEERRAFVDLDMGPVIKKNMNRCIHCTRCIRFGEEVAKIREMIAIQRGNNTEITTFDGRPLETDYAGNYADICPTGSLTLKDFRFKKRVWFLKKTDSVCEGCSRGCNMEIHQDGDIIYRCVPRENSEINKHWLCDEGRFNFEYVNRDDRVTTPCVLNDGKLVSSEWNSSLEHSKGVLSQKKGVILVGSDLTQEEAVLLLDFFPKYLPGFEVFHFGTSQIFKVSQDGPEDEILKRKSKTANLHGFEKLGLKALEKLPVGIEAALVIRGGRAVLPDLRVWNIPCVGVGVFTNSESKLFSSILPGVSFAEKEGTVINFQGKEQKFKPSIPPVGQSKPLSEILMMWVHQKTIHGAV